MKCPNCGSDVEWDDGIVSPVDNNHDAMSLEWFCESCDISGTAEFLLDEDTIKIIGEDEGDV